MLTINFSAQEKLNTKQVKYRQWQFKSSTALLLIYFNPILDRLQDVVGVLVQNSPTPPLYFTQIKSLHVNSFLVPPPPSPF